MGKTKIKTIDDSIIEEKKTAPAPKKSSKKPGEDILVAKLKEELGMGEETKANTSEVKPEKTSQADISEVSKKAQKKQKPGKSKPRSKKYQEVVKDLDRSKAYPINEAIEMVKKLSLTKFNGTLEAHINTLQTGLRGMLQLPYASGKKLRILAFGKGAENSGADLVGTDSTIEEIEKNKINFDLIIATSVWMPKLAKVAKVLGPKGLIPNPKNGTITDDLKKAVDSFQAGKTEYKTESKAPVIHLALGKLNQPNSELEANLKILLSTLGKTKIKKVTLSPTMGPGVKLELTSV